MQIDLTKHLASKRATAVVLGDTAVSLTQHFRHQRQNQSVALSNTHVFFKPMQLTETINYGATLTHGILSRPLYTQWL